MAVVVVRLPHTIGQVWVYLKVVPAAAALDISYHLQP